MGGADQLLRVCVGLALEAADKAVWVFLSSAPLFVEMAPLPSLMPPSQTAAPNVFILTSPRVVVACFQHWLSRARQMHLPIAPAPAAGTRISSQWPNCIPQSQSL
jgi:hypothetical protein